MQFDIIEYGNGKFYNCGKLPLDLKSLVYVGYEILRGLWFYFSL